MVPPALQNPGKRVAACLSLLQSWGENQAAPLTPTVPPAQTQVVGRAQARGSGENSMSHSPARACPSWLRTGGGRFHR